MSPEKLHERESPEMSSPERQSPLASPLKNGFTIIQTVLSFTEEQQPEQSDYHNHVFWKLSIVKEDELDALMGDYE